MPSLLALDQGTTSSRAILFDAEGTIVAVGQREFEQIFPRPGWVEHDPREIWESQSASLDEALRAAGASAGDVAGIGITNQRETTIVWDRATGEPIHNAIVWQDRRTAPMCDRLRAEGAEDVFRAKTGLLLDPYFSGTKIAWLLENVDGVRARAERGELAFGTVDTWLAWNLTGGALHVTDASNASRTLLYDIHAGDWDHELLGLLGVPRAMLPEVRDSAEVYGTVRAGAAAGVPIAGIVGDQQAATFGQMCVAPAQAKNTYGTGCFLLMNTGGSAQPSEHRLLTTIGWRLSPAMYAGSPKTGGAAVPTYCLEGSVFTGGAIVQWLRDGLGLIERSADIEPLAASVPDAGGVVLVPALTGLGAPHWDPHARGLIGGLTRGTTKAHIARAALDAIALSVTELMRAMEADAGLELGELRVDGGAAVNDLLLQIQADLLQRTVIRPTVLETTALGAAYMAGLATGVYASIRDIHDNWREDRRFEPSISADEAGERLERWQAGVERARGWEQERP